MGEFKSFEDTPIKKEHILRVKRLHEDGHHVMEHFYIGDGVSSFVNLDYRCIKAVAASKKRLFSVYIADKQQIRIEPTPIHNELVDIWYTTDLNYTNADGKYIDPVTTDSPPL